MKPHRLASLPNLAQGLLPTDRTLSRAPSDNDLHTIQESLTSAATSFRHALSSRLESHLNTNAEDRAKDQSRWRDRLTTRTPSGGSTTRAVDLRPSPAQRTQWVLESLDTSQQSDRQVAVKQKFPVNLPPHIATEWNSRTAVCLQKIVERALLNSPESASIDLVGIGANELTARPTIIVTCANTAKVKAALKRKFHCDRSIFDIKVREGRVLLSRGQGSRRRGSGKGGAKRSSGYGDELDERYTSSP